MKIRITYTPDKYKKYINRLHNAYIRTTICPYCNSIDIKRRYETNNSNPFTFTDKLFARFTHIIFCTCRDCGTQYNISFKTPYEVGNLKPYFNILERNELK